MNTPLACSQTEIVPLSVHLSFAGCCGDSACLMGSTEEVQTTRAYRDLILASLKKGK